jgi:hypothetical protein
VGRPAHLCIMGFSVFVVLFKSAILRNVCILLLVVL